MGKMGYPQQILLSLYRDCKQRTKKKTEISGNGDEQLIRFMLQNSSIVEHDSERAYSKVANAIYVACKQLCSGQWCMRTHCKNYSSHSAYHCVKTRPSVCKEYKAYIEKKAERKNKDNEVRTTEQEQTD